MAPERVRETRWRQVRRERGGLVGDASDEAGEKASPRKWMMKRLMAMAVERMAPHGVHDAAFRGPVLRKRKNSAGTLPEAAASGAEEDGGRRGNGEEGSSTRRRGRERGDYGGARTARAIRRRWWRAGRRGGDFAGGEAGCGNGVSGEADEEGGETGGDAADGEGPHGHAEGAVQKAGLWRSRRMVVRLSVACEPSAAPAPVP